MSKEKMEKCIECGKKEFKKGIIEICKGCGETYSDEEAILVIAKLSDDVEHKHQVSLQCARDGAKEEVLEIIDKEKRRLEIEHKSIHPKDYATCEKCSYYDEKIATCKELKVRIK